MIRTTLVISNKLGLHARASAKLTKLASSFKCEVFMTRNTRRVNAKSIMGIMMLAAGLGAEVELETEGEDEQQAAQAITALVNDKFGKGKEGARPGHPARRLSPGSGACNGRGCRPRESAAAGRPC
jgi:phosphocarrier protein HPr